MHGHHRHEVPFVDLAAEDAHDLELVAEVERARRFVQHEQGGLLGQGAGDEDPLALAAAEALDIAVGQVGEPERLDDLGDDLEVTATALRPMRGRRPRSAVSNTRMGQRAEMAWGTYATSRARSRRRADAGRYRRG